MDKRKKQSARSIIENISQSSMPEREGYVIMRSDLKSYLSSDKKIICHPDKEVAEKIARIYGGVVKTYEEAKEIMNKINKENITYKHIHKYKGAWFYWNKSGTNRIGSFVTKNGAETHRQIYLSEIAEDNQKCTCADEVEGFQCIHCQEMRHNL